MWSGEGGQECGDMKQTEEVGDVHGCRIFSTCWIDTNGDSDAGMKGSKGGLDCRERGFVRSSLCEFGEFPPFLVGAAASLV